jgi:GNAT superfamily N-acetyltransferase
MERFSNHFPCAKHRTFVWDIPDLPRDIVPAKFVENGFRHESVDALALNGPLCDAPLPSGISIRPIEAARDWAAALELQCEVAIEEGFDETGYRTYLEGRNVSRRIQIGTGLGQWVGAFDGDLLVAQMGMFHNSDVARYQSVETRKSHRRRGICSALLRHCALWALGRAPDAKVVIVAEMDSDAGRLYRSMGFAHVETIHGVIRGAD